MAIYDKNGLLQRLVSKIRSAGIGGLTKALDVREFLTDLIDTLFSLTSGSSSGNQDLDWDPEVTYNLTDNKYAISRQRIFESKADDNLGNEPPYIPDAEGNYANEWWEEVSAAPKSAIQEYDPNGLYIDPDLTIVHEGGRLIRLDAPRPFQTVDLETEITEGKWLVLTGVGGSVDISGKVDKGTNAQTQILYTPQSPSFFNGLFDIDGNIVLKAALDRIVGVYDPGGGGSTTNTAWVQKFGEDASALVGRPDKPFLTFQAAINALPIGSVYLIFGPGTWDESVIDIQHTVSSHHVGVILAPGTIIKYSGHSGNGDIFTWNPLTGTVANRRAIFFYGTGQGHLSGQIIRDGSGTGVISQGNWGAYNLDLLKSTRGEVISAADGYWQNINRIESTAGAAIRIYRNLKLIDVNEIISSGGPAINLGGQLDFGSGVLFRSVRLIRSTNTHAIISGGNVRRFIFEDIGKVESTVGSAIRANCMNFISNAEIISKLNTSAGHVIELTESVSPYVSRFRNCRIIATHADALSIKTAANVNIELDCIVRNRVLDTAFTITDAFGGSRDYFNINNISITENFGVL